MKAILLSVLVSSIWKLCKSYIVPFEWGTLRQNFSSQTNVFLSVVWRLVKKLKHSMISTLSKISLTMFWPLLAHPSTLQNKIEFGLFSFVHHFCNTRNDVWHYRQPWCGLIFSQSRSTYRFPIIFSRFVSYQACLPFSSRISRLSVASHTATFAIIVRVRRKRTIMYIIIPDIVITIIIIDICHTSTMKVQRVFIRHVSMWR